MVMHGIISEHDRPGVVGLKAEAPDLEDEVVGLEPDAVVVTDGMPSRLG